MKSRRRPLDIRRLTLVAAPTAIGCSQLLAPSALSAWGLREMEPAVNALTHELVAAAVDVAGDAAFLQIRMVLVEDAVIVEVVDRDHGPPPDARWLCYRQPSGERVVWAEIPLPVWGGDATAG